MVDSKGQRVCAFGKFAGVGGLCFGCRHIVNEHGGVFGGLVIFQGGYSKAVWTISIKLLSLGDSSSWIILDVLQCYR